MSNKKYMIFQDFGGMEIFYCAYLFFMLNNSINSKNLFKSTSIANLVYLRLH